LLGFNLIFFLTLQKKIYLLFSLGIYIYRCDFDNSV
jgi:hypothetical protein